MKKLLMGLAIAVVLTFAIGTTSVNAGGPPICMPWDWPCDDGGDDGGDTIINNNNNPKAFGGKGGAGGNATIEEGAVKVKTNVKNFLTQEQFNKLMNKQKQEQKMKQKMKQEQPQTSALACNADDTSNIQRDQIQKIQDFVVSSSPGSYGEKGRRLLRSMKNPSTRRSRLSEAFRLLRRQPTRP